MKKIIALVLSLAMVLSLSIGASATAIPQSRDTRTQIEKQFIDNINLIEKEIENQGTTVVKALRKEKNRLENLAKTENNIEDKAKLQRLIRNYANMISEYETYKSQGGDQIVLKGAQHPVYSAATAAIVSYFVTKQYALAAELLAYAKEESNGGTYEPYCGREAPQTKEYKRIVNIIKNSGKPSGGDQAEFKKGGTVADNDFYYGIHGCRYKFNNGSLTFTDRYDFAVSKDYEGLAGTAINTMYLAQQMGVIVPYNVVIKVRY